MKPITRNLNFSGIYCIINVKNNKRYIGSSKNIRLRLQSHKSLLKNNHHENRVLQRSWNKYGENNFNYYILEKCEEQDLLIREQFYIDTLKPEYNLNPISNKPPHTKDSRKKQSETRKLLYKSGKLKPSFKHIKTYVYDLEGNFIKEYSSMKDAAIGEFGKNTGAVRSACYGIENPSHRVYNRRFYLQKLDVLPIIEKKKTKPNRIIVHFISEDEHLIFKGWNEAANHFNTTIYNIMQYKSKNLKFKRKYMVTTSNAV